MENKDTETDYHEAVRVGDQRWKLVEITIKFFLFEIYIHYFYIYTGNFQVPPEKNNLHSNCQFPPKIPIWPKSLLYKPSEKWLNTPIPSPTGHENYGICQCIFLVVITVETFILKCL